MENIILIGIIALIIGLAVWYIRKEKRRGVQCIGCPQSKVCSGQSAHCCLGAIIAGYRPYFPSFISFPLPQMRRSPRSAAFVCFFAHDRGLHPRFRRFQRILSLPFSNIVRIYKNALQNRFLYIKIELYQSTQRRMCL